MKTIFHVLLCLTIMTSWSAAGAFAQAPAGNVDRTFMEKAAGDGIFEVESGKLAQKMAKHEEVKKFAQRMVTDHTSANEKLMNIAKSKGITLPAKMDAKHQKIYDKLQKSSNFDADYASEMVKDHQEAVSDFQNQQSKTTDPDLKAFVQNTLPILKEHLQLAEDMQKKVETSSKK